jgi:N-acetylmuramoyl-L-alanine amidase
MIVIKDTPLGYLRVREDASTTASESGRVKPGETYEMLEEKPDWFKIKIDNKSGWVSAVYAQKQTQ